ncbi:MAG TPA: hypothetical protein VD927_06110 [Chryseosolibacter sp.]|nr:hypothetical protein [Chryseosolibacter sp.]
MKKILFTGLIVFAALFTGQAQISQGTILVGAGSNFGFTNVSPDGGDSFSEFDLHGKVGYFFIENVVGGLKLDYAKIDDTSKIGFGIFGRYYLNNTIILGASLGTYKEDYGETDASATVLGIEGGYAAFITDNIAIEPTLNIDLLSGDLDATRFGLNVGFSFYLGSE